jgi:hypothetical protein
VEFSTYGSCFDPVIFFTNNFKFFTVSYVIIHKLLQIAWKAATSH